MLKTYRYLIETDLYASLKLYYLWRIQILR